MQYTNPKKVGSGVCVFLVFFVCLFSPEVTAKSAELPLPAISKGFHESSGKNILSVHCTEGVNISGWWFWTSKFKNGETIWVPTSNLDTILKPARVGDRRRMKWPFESYTFMLHVSEQVQTVQTFARCENSSVSGKFWHLDAFFWKWRITVRSRSISLDQDVHIFSRLHQTDVSVGTDPFSGSIQVVEISGHLKVDLSILIEELLNHSGNWIRRKSSDSTKIICEEREKSCSSNSSIRSRF